MDFSQLSHSHFTRKRSSDMLELVPDHDDPLSYGAETGPGSSEQVHHRHHNKEGEEMMGDREYSSPEDEEAAAVVSELPGSSKKLGVMPLAVLIFYGVSGGAFGVEETVRSAGHFYTLLGFLIMPMVWSVPEALMTAELGSAFPEASGCVAWVHNAFGDKAGWIAGYFGWISGATDNAIYPVLFVDYLLQFLSGAAEKDVVAALNDPKIKFFLFTVISCTLAYTNWRGLDLVGNMSMLICLLAMSPFIILSLIGLPQVDPSRWFEPPQMEDTTGTEQHTTYTSGLFSWTTLGSIAWGPYLNNMFWNLNSFDNAATYAEDVNDPGRVLPRALGWAVAMVASCYFIPLLVTFGISKAPPDAWVDGYFSVVATQIAGSWLGGWLVFASGISNIAMFQAELSSDALKLMGMAERGYLPRIFATRSPRYGTPTYSLLLGTLVIIAMTSISHLDELIEMLNFNYALSLVMNYCAFIKLRVTHAEVERPFRIPLSTSGCILLFTPTFIAIFAVLGLASFKTYVFNVIVTIVGFALYWLRQNAQRNDNSYASVGDGQNSRPRNNRTYTVVAEGELSLS